MLILWMYYCEKEFRLERDLMQISFLVKNGMMILLVLQENCNVSRETFEI